MPEVDRPTFTGALAMVLTISLIVLIGLLFFKAIPEGNGELIFTAFGVLATGATGSWAFYFGSSQGSKDKDATIAEAINPTRPDVP